MRSDPERVFPIQGIVAFCIALHLSPETSRAYIAASPSKFLNNTDMKLYQYALAQWYDLPVSVVNRRLVEAGAKPLTNIVDGYFLPGVDAANFWGDLLRHFSLDVHNSGKAMFKVTYWYFCLTAHI